MEPPSSSALAADQVLWGPYVHIKSYLSVTPSFLMLLILLILSCRNLFGLVNPAMMGIPVRMTLSDHPVPGSTTLRKKNGGVYSVHGIRCTVRRWAMSFRWGGQLTALWMIWWSCVVVGLFKFTVCADYQGMNNQWRASPVHLRNVLSKGILSCNIIF